MHVEIAAHGRADLADQQIGGAKLRIVARAPSGRLVYDLIFLRRGRSVVILVFATTSQPGDLERRLAVRLAGRMR